MWKNWRQPQAPATQSNIISYDDYYDDDRYLETIHEVESIRERPQSVAHPPAALPELPLYVEILYQYKYLLYFAHRLLTFLESSRSAPPS